MLNDPNMTAFYVWLTIGLLAVGADLLLLGTTYLLMVGLAACIAAFPAMVGAPVLMQMMVFAVMGVVLCFYPWTQQRRKSKQPQETAEEVQNMDIGHEVEVNNVNRLGQAKVFYRGTIWDAAPETGYQLQRGTWVITGLKGNLLILKPKEQH